MKGYKIGINEKLFDFVLIELEVPEEYPGGIVYEHKYEIANNPYSHNTESKYRVVVQYRSNVARVLNIRKIKFGTYEYIDSAMSLYDEHFYYRPGEMIYPDAFDPNPDNICTNGIHFFGTYKEAISYTEDDWPRHRYNCEMISVLCGRH